MNLLNEKLVSNKYFIKYQIEELRKAEEGLAVFKNCLQSQNEVIDMLLSDEILIEQEIISRQNTDNSEIEIIMSADVKSNNLMHNISLDKLEISVIGNEIIRSFFRINDDIYIGGSNGLLIKYNNGHVIIFSKNVGDDIIYIFKRKYKRICALTKTKIISFSMEGYLKSCIDGHEIKYLMGNGFIMHSDGKISKDLFYAKKGFVNDSREPNIRCSYRRKGFNLFSKNNSYLYKIPIYTHRFSSKPEIIPNVINVTRMLTLEKGERVLCCSNDSIWVLNVKCEVLDYWIFRNGIKFVECYKQTTMVVNGVNEVFIFYNLEHVHTENVYGDITAILLLPDRLQAYVGVGHSVYVIKYALP